MKTVGIIGGGQLAQLLSVSAYQLGLKTVCFVEEEDCPAKRCSPLFLGKLSDNDALEKFSTQVDVITVENENVDIDTLKKCEKIKPVFPHPDIIQIAQDRLFEKNYFQKLLIPTTPFFPVHCAADLKKENGFLKTRRLGYDGKGQIHITPDSNLTDAWNLLNKPAIFEHFIDFETEVSQLVARNSDGDIQFFPLIENKHQEGILRTSHFAHFPALEKKAQDYARTLVESLNYIGVLAIEFFVQKNELIMNEIAPRVHNSGHLTIEGCNVSQFDQHLRAILNLSLIKPAIIQSVEMINIIGEWPENLDQFHHIYDYGKAARKNRKLGHAICCYKVKSEWNGA